jgi:peptidoglycan/LPS O-acetylase OafA/YrhL
MRLGGAFGAVPGKSHQSCAPRGRPTLARVAGWGTRGRSGERGDGFRADVEGLRALAVILVVLFHARHSLVPGGFVGVDVFFVLSGFLITGLLLREFEERGRISLTRFWARRVRRLLPLSTLVLTATLIGSWLIVAPIDRPPIASSVRAAALYQANWHFASQADDYFATSVEKDPVLHYWSLSLEEQYYVVWPLVLTLLAFVALRVGLVRRRPRPTVAVLLAVVFATSLALSIRTTGDGSALAYYALRTRAWELAAGALVAVAVPVLQRVGLFRTRQALAVAGLAAILLAAVRFSETTLFPGSAALLPVLGTAAVVAAGTGGRPTAAARLLGLGVPRYVGRISYGWYLWHWPCLVLAATWATYRWGHVPGRVTVFAVVLSFALAVVSHYLVEMPVRRAPRLVRVPALTLALGAGLTAVAAGFATSLLDNVRPVGQAVAATAAADQTGSLQPASSTTRLREDPAAARVDWGVKPGSCLSHQELDSRIVCAVGNRNGSTRVLLVGDSHAAAYIPALDRLGAARDWRVEVNEGSACPIWDVRVWLSAGGENRGCEKWRRRALARIAGSHYDLILIAVAESERRTVHRDDGTSPPLAEIPRWWAAGAERTMAVLGPAARRVVVIDDPPLPGGDVLGCLSLHSTNIAACEYSRSRRAYLDHDLLEAAAPALSRYDVQYADLAPLLCPTGRCPVVTPDGIIMFKDGAHLSATFSRLMWRLLGQAIDSATPTPPSPS